jgi:hypothetical protein
VLESAPVLQEPPADTAPDPAVLRAERRLALLAELAEIGMELARGLKAGDPAETFAPLSRAIRLTLALEAKADAELSDLKVGIVRASEERRTQTVERQKAAAARDAEGRPDKVRDLVCEAAEAEIEDYDALKEFMEAIDERLEEDEAYVDIARWPLRETVENLCRDLKLNPDWSRRDGDGWKTEGPTRPRCSPFNQPSATRSQKPPGHDLE